MLRRIVGWNKSADDEWSDVYSKVRSKIQQAPAKQPVRDWMEELARQKSALEKQIKTGCRNRLTVRATIPSKQENGTMLT